MARLTTYLNDNSISGEDRLVGSNYIGVNNYQTNNFKIKDLTEYIQGQISISPSNSTLKTNGGLVNEVINGTNSLAIDLSATNITGQLANSDLANSSITINGTAVSLGGTITIGEVTGVTAGTYLNGGGTEGTVTVNHDTTSRTDTTSTAAPAYGATFTVIDTLTTNTTGHVTAANVKTVTIPSSDDTTYTIEAVDSTNDSIIRLVGTDSTTDDIKLIAGSNITLSTSEANDTITIASQAFGTVFTVNSQSAMVSATSTGGDIVIRTDVSKTFIHNGGSAGDVTDFSELQFSGINTLALTAGDGIDLSRTTVTNTNNDVTVTNSLATSSERGGVKIGYTTDANNRNYAIQLDSEKMYVNVPWTDANDNTFRTIEVDSNGNGSANETLGATETLRFKKGTNVTLAEDAGEITISSANTEYNVVDSNAAGLAPQLPATDGGKFLKADGTYEVPAYTTNTNTQNTYSINIPENTTKFRLSGTISGANDTEDDIEFVGSGATTVTRTNENKFTISSTDNNDNTQNTTELSFVAEDDGANPPVATGNIILRNTISGASSSEDDIKIYAGNNITLTRNDEHKITISETTTYTHPAHPGDDINIDTEELTGATVISDLDFNITTDTLGHVTDANASIATRDLTLANLGYTGATDANNYSLPTAASDTLGGVKVGTNLSIASGVLSADEQTANDFTDALKTKLDGIEVSATADQTAAEIKTLVGTGNEKFVPAAGSAGEFLKHDGTFGTPSYTTNTNNYLDGISKSGNTLTFSVNGADNQTYTFGSNAFNSTAYLTAEADTLTSVTGRNASTANASTFSGGLTSSGPFTSSGTGTNAYAYFMGNSHTGTNNAPPPSSFTHGLALAWNNSGGSREFEHWWATGADIGNNSTGQATNRSSYMSWFNRFCPTGGTTVDTRMAKWYGRGEFELTDLSGLPGGGATPTFSTPYIRLPLVAGSTGQVLTRKSGSTRDTEWTTLTIPTNNNQLTNGAGYITAVPSTVSTAVTFSNTIQIGSSGTANLYLGNTISPSSSDKGARFHSSNNDFYFDFQGDSTQHWFLRDYDGSGGTHTRFSFDFINAKFIAGGDVVAFGSPSDKTLKENIKPIDNALDKVEKLQGVTFDWKEQDITNLKEDIGFIAQDVQKVLPELVRENENGKLSLRHQGIIPILLEAIKELSDKVKALENGSTK